MSLMNVTSESLTTELNQEVPPIYVVVAKNAVLGMTSESICEILGCTGEELDEIESNDLYKQVRIYVGAAQSQARVQQTLGWDAIEDMAMDNLIKRLPYEKDGEFLLRVAAVANKAVRRQSTDAPALDPSSQNGKTIKLTSRLVQRLTRNGDREQVEERQLSISDGSMKNPTFDEIDSILSVSRQPVLSRKLEIQTHTAESLDLAELDTDMKNRGA